MRVITPLPFLHATITYLLKNAYLYSLFLLTVQSYIRYHGMKYNSVKKIEYSQSNRLHKEKFKN